MTLQCSIGIALWILVYVSAVITRPNVGTFATGIVFGWLFLPNFSYTTPGFPDWDKSILFSIVCAGIMFAAHLGQPVSRFSLLDLPALGFPLSAVFASAANGLGIYDGLSNGYLNFWVWSVPYLVGRRVFGTSNSAISFIRAIVFGGLIYSAFCLYEIKMSPQLHLVTYGAAPRENANYFLQAVRFGLWRPTVYMEHGLALALFMAIATVLAWSDYASGSIRHLAGMSIRTIVGILGLTTFLCVSSGAIVLMVLGCGIIAMRGKNLRRTALLLTSLIPIVYPMTRMLGGDFLVKAVESSAVMTVGETRTESFLFRL